MQLKYKMSMGAALIAVLPVVITAYLLVSRAGEIGDSALQSKVRSHIISIRDSKKQQVEDYFKLVTNQMEHFSSDPTTIAMMQGFKLAYPEFLKQIDQSGGSAITEEEGPPIPGEEEAGEEDSEGDSVLDTYRTLLEEYYSYDFTEE
jgi:methyl-accepting chemotaxis protein